VRKVLELAWLVTRLSWGNRLRRFKRALWQPKTLLSLLLVGGYVLTLFVSVIVARFTGEFTPDHAGTAYRGQLYVPLWILVLLGLNLYAFGRFGGLAFRQSEARFVLQAPLTRRQLVAYWIARQQPGLWISAAFLSLVRWGMVPGSNLILFLLGLFLSLQGILLWSLCGRLLRSSLDDAGRSQLWTRLPLALGLGALVVCAGLAYPGGELTVARFDAWLQSPPLAQFCEPLRLVIDGMLSRTVAEGLPALGVLFAGNLVLLVLTLLRATPVEEATLRQAELIDVLRNQGWKAFRAARRGKPRPPQGQPFSIAGPGSPVAGLVWKNLIACGRHHTPAALALGLLLAAGIGTEVRLVLPPDETYSAMSAVVVLYLTGLIAFLSLSQQRHDLRMDLPRFELIKAWPLSAREVLWGEVLGITVVASAYALIGWTLAVALFSLPPSMSLAVGWPQRLALWVSGVPVIAAGMLTFVAVQNAAALLFPTWVKLGPQHQAEVSKLGGYAFVLGVTCAIAGTLATGPLFLTIPIYVIGNVLAPAPFAWAVPTAWLTAALVLAEVWLLLRVLERRVEQFTPTSIPG